MISGLSPFGRFFDNYLDRKRGGTVQDMYNAFVHEQIADTPLADKPFVPAGRKVHPYGKRIYTWERPKNGVSLPLYLPVPDDEQVPIPAPGIEVGGAGDATDRPKGCGEQHFWLSYPFDGTATYSDILENRAPNVEGALKKILSRTAWMRCRAIRVEKKVYPKVPVGRFYSVLACGADDIQHSGDDSASETSAPTPATSIDTIFEFVLDTSTSVAHFADEMRVFYSGGPGPSDEVQDMIDFDIAQAATVLFSQTGAPLVSAPAPAPASAHMSTCALKLARASFFSSARARASQVLGGKGHATCFLSVGTDISTNIAASCAEAVYGMKGAASSYFLPGLDCNVPVCIPPSPFLLRENECWCTWNGTWMKTMFMLDEARAQSSTSDYAVLLICDAASSGSASAGVDASNAASTANFNASAFTRICLHIPSGLCVMTENALDVWGFIGPHAEEPARGTINALRIHALKKYAYAESKDNEIGVDVDIHRLYIDYDFIRFGDAEGMRHSAIFAKIMENVHDLIGDAVLPGNVVDGNIRARSPASPTRSDFLALYSKFMLATECDSFGKILLPAVSYTYPVFTPINERIKILCELTVAALEKEKEKEKEKAKAKTGDARGATYAFWYAIFVHELGIGEEMHPKTCAATLSAKC